MALHPHRYLDLIQSAVARITAASPAALSLAVPCCAGWDVAEVVRHTGSVYNHKVAIMRLGRAPERGGWLSRPPAEVELVPWFDSSAQTLIEELAMHDPDDWAHTWWPADPTMRFWYRRMALESVVHRVDVEQAVGGDVSTVDAALASDGIDEVLTVFLGVHDAGGDGGAIGAVRVESGGHTWVAHIDDAAIRVEKHNGGAEAAVLGGDPAAVFLYLWGRVPRSAVEVGGDDGLVHELRRRLAAATQ